MKILELVDFVKTQSTYDVYPLAFPSAEKAPGNAIAIQYLTSYTKAKGGMSRVNIQMIVRSNHPAQAEDEALRLANYFYNKTDFMVGITHVILTDIRTPFPLFVGRDNGDNYRYTVTMNFLIDKE